MLARDFFTLLLMSTIVDCSLLDDVGPRQKAKAKLYHDLENHISVKSKLSPDPEDGVINVDVGFWLSKVTEVVETKQTLDVFLSVQAKWNDTDMAWNSSDYHNISHVVLQENTIWTPSLYISNSARERKTSLNAGEDVNLDSDGSYSYFSCTFSSTHCNYDLTLFPFDTQTCKIILSFDNGDAVVKTRNAYFLDLLLPEESVVFNLNGEWTIVDKQVRSFQIWYPPLEMIEIKLTLKRAYLFYVLCHVLPMMTTSLLTLLVFWIPPGSGEKISYLVSIYVSTSLFVNMVSDTLPRNISSEDRVPRMTWFLIVVIIQCVLAFICTIFVMHRFQKEQKAASEEIVDQNEKHQDKVTDFDTQSTMGENARILESSGDASGVPWCKRLVAWIKKISASVSPSEEISRSQKWSSVTATTLDRLFFVVLSSLSIAFYTLVFSAQ